MTNKLATSVTVRPAWKAVAQPPRDDEDIYFAPLGRLTVPWRVGYVELVRTVSGRDEMLTWDPTAAGRLTAESCYRYWLDQAYGTPHWPHTLIVSVEDAGVSRFGGTSICGAPAHGVIFEHFDRAVRRNVHRSLFEWVDCLMGHVEPYDPLARLGELTSAIDINELPKDTRFEPFERVHAIEGRYPLEPPGSDTVK